MIAIGNLTYTQGCCLGCNRFFLFLLDDLDLVVVVGRPLVDGVVETVVQLLRGFVDLLEDLEMERLGDN